MATQFANRNSLWSSLLLRRDGSRAHEEGREDPALCRKLTRIGKYCGAFLLRKRLKRYNFKLYNQNGVETIYSPYAIFGIGMMELELKTHFPHQYAWLGPLGTSIEKAEDYPLDISSYQDKTKVLVTCGTSCLGRRRTCFSKPSSWPKTIQNVTFCHSWRWGKGIL